MYIKAELDVPPLPPLNIHDLLFRRPDRVDIPDYPLHVDGLTGRTRTYYEFLERVHDGATALSAPASEGGLGLQPEKDMVGIYSFNCLDYITLVHAVLAQTVPFALLPSFSTSRELVHLLRLSRATCLFVDPQLLPNARHVAREVGIPDERIFVLEGRADGRRGFGDMIDGVRRRGATKAPVRSARKDTLAHLIFSSGTSGLPKAVAISHGNLCCSVMQIAVWSQAKGRASQEALDPSVPEKQVHLAFLPFYHSHGLHSFIFRCFLLSCTIVVLPKWDAKLALKLIPKYRITHLPVVPSQVHQLVHLPNFENADLSSVTNVTSSAAYLPPQLAAKLTKCTPGMKGVMEAYGMSEATIGIMLRPPPELAGAQASDAPAGMLLLPGLEARILREDGSEAAVGEPGELFIRADTNALGYWGNDQATRETFLPGGWLKTGDRFRANESGQFFFDERVKDTLKIAGMQVSPTEIEDVLLAHPEKLIVDACVAGVSGGRTSDERNPRAWVVLSPAGRGLGAQVAVRKLDAWVRENLSKYKWLRGGIEIVQQIPKNPTGKTLRRVLVEEHEKRVETAAKL
ncbi:acetyl-CoA synthetase-like protein [Obba rivulosa]|uniref:Acetyl-CoA synthetase-like protein n=1 Tax=Obba rivulosa TaxID=1052685 RepID=A0A8E2AW00_9APHY|nr:acetyl-CoA synthetase-like protein [Obba rivulosa]